MIYFHLLEVINIIYHHIADFLISAAVAEFKGPDIFGVVRLAQVNMELTRIEATFSGLLPGKHGWSINEFGDLTKGAASTGKVFNPSTGKVFNPTSQAASEEVCCFIVTFDEYYIILFSNTRFYFLICSYS